MYDVLYSNNTSAVACDIFYNISIFCEWLIMKPWTREDTRDWIAQLELRVEDLNYYLNETVQWCETHNVLDDRRVFACSMMTALWVTWQRNEHISRWELMEVLGVRDWNSFPDEEVELGTRFQGLDLEEMLEQVAEWS